MSQSFEPDLTISDGTQYTFNGETSFEHAISELKEGYCDAIYGPQGGILVTDENNCLVYLVSKEPIYFSLKNYLGKWRLLRNFK